MLAETTSVSNTLYTYDANGNTLAVMKDGTLVYSYTYGLFGTQDSYISNAVQYTYYTYRPDGLRHSIGDKIHIWDGANIVADVEGNSVIVYFRGINLIFANEDGEQTYYHFNAHGDVVVLTNESGEKEKTYSYTSFGIEYNPSTLDDNPFRYCGEYYDIESGNIYLRARYYNSDLGRFTQEDPIRDGRNWYSYCDSNPINACDPYGLWTIGFSLGANINVGIGVSISIGFYFDDDGNFDWQWSYVVPGVDGTASIGALDVGLGGTLQVTDRDTVYDLYGPATTIGASGGPLWYVGADVVSFSDVTASNAEINGFQLTGGIGYGVDVHVVESYTRPVGNRGIVQHMGKGVLPNKTVYSSLCE